MTTAKNTLTAAVRVTAAVRWPPGPYTCPTASSPAVFTVTVEA